MEGDGDGVVWGTFGTVGRLMLMEARWDVGLATPQHLSLHTFSDYRCQGHRDSGGGFQASGDCDLLVGG